MRLVKMVTAVHARAKAARLALARRAGTPAPPNAEGAKGQGFLEGHCH